MDNKKLGVTILIFSLFFGFIVYNYIDQTNMSAKSSNCMTRPECASYSAVLNWSHFAIGLVFAVFSLGFYLIFFSRSETLLRDAIKQLEDEKNRLEKEHKIKISDDRFSTILKTLDPNEQKILKVIKENEGIAQNTLRIKTELSKAKISQVLTDFAKKNIIRKEEKGKTYSIYMSENF